ncbi:MAG: DUF4198 domain-containing protein [Pyramidobacter sp.]|jgi:uncharacterized GH25 family protein
MSHSKMYSLFSAAVLVSALSGVAFAHELTLRPTGEVKEGESLSMTVQSAHRFIVPEEVEVLDRVKAGPFVNGAFQPQPLTGNEKDLCIDFTVPEIKAGEANIILAEKDGEVWCITNEGGKSGARKDLEAQGLKVKSATKYDKYAKLILNASGADTKFAAVAGLPLEITPATNPADAKVGEFFEVKIELQGQPYTGPVWATYDGFDTEHENTYAYYTEAENGTAFVKITAPGFWGVRAMQSGLPGVEGQYDSRSLRSFLLFEVK